jgi:uncharacterized membrane protein YfcA
MRGPLKIASALALAGIVVPPLLYFWGDLPHDAVNTIALLATIAWFVATPLWMGRRSRT